MIIGPRSDSILAPAEPSRHSIVTPLVIVLSEVIDSQEITSPLTATGSGAAEEQEVSAMAKRNIPNSFIGNPHRS
jgi:hypothetical protein